MKKLTPPPSKTPFLDKNGFMAREWVHYFQKITESISELQAAVQVLQGGP